MKKRFFKILIAAFLIFALVAPAQAVYQDMWASVYTWDGTMGADGKAKLTRLTSGVTFKVLQRNSDTAETLYYYNVDAMTSLTNPVTTTNFADNAVCNDNVAFRVDPGETGDTYVDVIVTNTDGFYSTFVEDFDKYTHSIVIDQRPGIAHVGTIWFSEDTTDETTTGVSFKADTLINDTRVEVVSTCAACTLDVGLLSSQTAGDADGLRDGVLLTTAGFVADTGVITAGATTVDYYPDSTYGDLLFKIIAGADATGAIVNGIGGKTHLGHVVTASNATTVTFTSSSTTSGAGYIYVEHIRLR